MNCPFCGKTVDASGGIASFCPYCGQKLALSDDAHLNELLQRAENEEDYSKKHDLLLEARQYCPEHPEVEKRLLYIGRLWEKGGKPDFYRIPFWPLNALEKPNEFSRRERKRMLDSFFLNPELKCVAELFDDETAFFKEYYGRMAKDYLELFVKGATSNNSILFFRRSEKSRIRSCLTCVAAMLVNLESSPDVPQEDKPLMKEALLKASRLLFGEEPPVM